MYAQMRRRLSTLGMSARSVEVDEFGLDATALARARPLLDLLQDRYWRIDAAGLEHLPPRGPCLLVANRSGLLPYDGLMLAHVIERALPHAGRPRFLVADWLMTLPFVQPPGLDPASSELFDLPMKILAAAVILLQPVQIGHRRPGVRAVALAEPREERFFLVGRVARGEVGKVGQRCFQCSASLV